MAVYDVNGDGLNDAVTSLQAHGWGFSWFEQKKAGDGSRTFVEHSIMGDFSTANAGDVTFSELHGSASADGAPEIITAAKRGTFIFWNNWKTARKQP
jgi:hypothetical protein